MGHKCKDTDYRCCHEEEGRKVCTYDEITRKEHLNNFVNIVSEITGLNDKVSLQVAEFYLKAEALDYNDYFGYRVKHGKLFDKDFILDLLCPVCGELAAPFGRLKDDRMVGQCGDSFYQELDQERIER